MSKTLITQTKLSDMAGVSRSAVSQACKNALSDAMEGSKVDLEHPEVQKWLQKKLAKKMVKDQKKTEKNLKDQLKQKEASESAQQETITLPKNNEIPVDDIKPEVILSSILAPTRGSKTAIPDLPDVSTLVQMPLGQIIQLYGTDEGFETFLKSRKLIEEVKIKEMDAESKRGNWIERETVSKRIIPLIDNSFRRLVDDLPESLAGTVVSLVKNGSDKMEVSDAIRKNISQILRGVKENSTQLISA